MDLKGRNRRASSMKAKIWWALASITCILVLSSVISIIEYNRVSTSVSTLINNDVESLKLIKKLDFNADEFNLNVLDAIELDDSIPAEIPSDGLISEKFIETNLTDLSENIDVDTLLAAFDTCLEEYSSMARSGVLQKDSLRVWYQQEFRPDYDLLKAEVKRVDTQLYTNLTFHSQSFQDAFYRSIVPGMVAMCSGLVLVFLLGYFFLSYYVHPILKMLHAIEAYSKLGRTYACKFDGDDQLAELNAEITDLVEENSTLKKRLKSCQNSRKECENQLKQETPAEKE